MRSGKIFTAVIYYIFTFSIGILLALFLPFYYLYSSESLNNMQEALESGNYSDAMSLVGGYYNRQPAFVEEFPDGGGIVLFEATTLVVTEEQQSDGQTEQITKMHKAYAGFVYGIKDSYSVSGNSDNGALMIVTDTAGVEHEVQILNTDSDGDNVNDSISTVDTNGFFYIDLAQDVIPSISSITLIDSKGEVFATVPSENSLNLNFDERFFADVDEFVTEYNRDVTTDEEKKQQAERCNQLDEEFLAKSTDYAKSSYGVVAKSAADRKAAVAVVLYFVAVYVVSDFILGKRYILKFFKWLLVKVFKVKFPEKKEPDRQEIFGNDYYCQVTMVLDTSAVADFAQSVQIHYSNGENEANFLLMKENGYTDTQRVKAGKYMNLHVDLDGKYTTANLPSVLVAEGYRKAFKINLTRQEV